MERSEIISKIKAITAKHVDVSSFQEDDEFTVLGLDSLDLVEIVMDIESEFSIQFEMDEITSFKTFKDLLDCLAAKLA